MKTRPKQMCIYVCLIAILCIYSGCKKNNIIFPTQIDEEDTSTSERGPVKQNDFKVILEEDEQVKFSFENIDKERVQKLYFSYNTEGEKVTTEITDFSNLYSIKNLSLDQPSNIEVWALGINGIASKKYTYMATPLPFEATKILLATTVNEGFLSGVFKIVNRTNSAAKLFYKIDADVLFQEKDIPSQFEEVNIEINELSKGKHTVSYYIVDIANNKSKEVTNDFDAYDLVKIPKENITLDVSSTAAGTNVNALLDGNINTYWKSKSNASYEHWVDFNLNEFTKIGGIGMLRRQDNVNGSFKNFEIEYFSQKEGDFVPLEKEFTFNSMDQPAALQQFIFDPIETNYIRIYFLNPVNSNILTAELAELQLLTVDY